MTNLSPSPSPAIKSRVPPWLGACGLSLLVSVAILLPFFWYGSASGHDFEFHVASWLDVTYQWKEGTLYPRWTAWTNHGFGEPRFIFYPPLSWILGATLTFIAPIAWVPALFILLVQTFAGTSAFILLRRLVSRRAAILASACYAANPDALLMIYIRSDFAEQLACAIFPLLLLAALRIGGWLDDSSHSASPIALFAISFAAVWLSNAPAGVIVTYSAGLLFAWAAFTQRSWMVAVRGLAGLALGFGLASFYLVPAAYEQRWVNIAQALSTALLPRQNFLFTTIDDPEHTWFNWIASVCALSLILLFALAALASRRFSNTQAPLTLSRNIWTALLVLGAGATLLTIRFTIPLWDYLPKLRFLQFPWRWMSIIALVFVCFVAALMDRKRGWIWFFVMLILSVPLGHFLVGNGWWDSDEMESQREAVVNGSGFDGTDEYDPLGDDHLDLPSNAPAAKLLPVAPNGRNAAEGRLEVVLWKTQQKLVRVHTTADVRLALRLLNYPAWKVTLNGSAVTPDHLDGTGQMVIPVPAGTSEIRIQFVRTPDRMAGMILFSLSLLALAILQLAEYWD